jgi:hypothetical protein
MDAEPLITPVEIPRRTFLQGLLAIGPVLMAAGRSQNVDFITLPRKIGKAMGGDKSCVERLRIARRGLFSGNQYADPPEALAPIWRWEIEVTFISQTAMDDRRAWFVEFFGDNPQFGNDVSIPADQWQWSSDRTLFAAVETPRETE